jgi:hypothetical protein
MILKNAHVSIAAVDLSSDVREVTVEDNYEEVVDTRMGHTATSRKAGLPEWVITIKFVQNYASARVNQTLRPLRGTNVAVVVRPDKASGASATNEEVQGTGLLQYGPTIAGAVGTMQEPTATIKSAGTALTYVTA